MKYDIRISDIHIEDDPYSTIPSTVNLSKKKVLEFIAQGGDWHYQVFEHKTDNIKLSGTTYGRGL